MTAQLNANYMPTTNAAGTFNVSSSGWVQGMFIDDPAIRYQIAGGVLATTETLPISGGVGVGGANNPPLGELGGLITRATNLTAAAAGQLTGFSVFNHAYGMVISSGSPVPLAGSGMQVNFLRLGSNARVAVAALAALASLEQGVITQQVSWDFVGQQLIPYIAAWVSATAASATYNSTTGIIALTFSPAPLGAGIGSTANGVYLSLSGLTASGGAGAANVGQLAGSFPIVSTATSGTVINLQGPIGLGAITLNSSLGTIAAGGGALPVKVLQIEVGNSMVVNYNAATGVATWNYTGTTAIILI
jgi:hypothetical protein